MQISESCWDPIPGGTFFCYVAQYCQVHVEIDFTPGPCIPVFYIAEWSNKHRGYGKFSTVKIPYANGDVLV